MPTRVPHEQPRAPLPAPHCERAAWGAHRVELRLDDKDRGRRVLLSGWARVARGQAIGLPRVPETKCWPERVDGRCSAREIDEVRLERGVVEYLRVGIPARDYKEGFVGVVGERQGWAQLHVTWSR